MSKDVISKAKSWFSKHEKTSSNDIIFDILNLESNDKVLAYHYCIISLHNDIILKSMDKTEDRYKKKGIFSAGQVNKIMSCMERILISYGNDDLSSLSNIEMISYFYMTKSQYAYIEGKRRECQLFNQIALQYARKLSDNNFKIPLIYDQTKQSIRTGDYNDIAINFEMLDDNLSSIRDDYFNIYTHCRLHYIDALVLRYDYQKALKVIDDTSPDMDSRFSCISDDDKLFLEFKRIQILAIRDINPVLLVEYMDALKSKSMDQYLVCYPTYLICLRCFGRFDLLDSLSKIRSIRKADSMTSNRRNLLLNAPLYGIASKMDLPEKLSDFELLKHFSEIHLATINLSYSGDCLFFERILAVLALARIADKHQLTEQKYLALREYVKMSLIASNGRYTDGLNLCDNLIYDPSMKYLLGI